MADSCGGLVIWCVGNLQHQRPTAMGRKSLIAWQGSEGAGGRGWGVGGGGAVGVGGWRGGAGVVGVRVWAFMAVSCGGLVIWCVGNLQHQRPTAMGRKSLIAWQGSEGAGGRGSRGGVPDGPFGYPARSRTLTRRCAPPSPVAQERG